MKYYTEKILKWIGYGGFGIMCLSLFLMMFSGYFFALNDIYLNSDLIFLIFFAFSFITFAVIIILAIISD